MSPQADHQEISELLASAALDILEGSERRRTNEHLLECADCRRLLTQYEDLVAELAMMQPGPDPDEEHLTRLRTRLVTRAAARPATPLALAGHPSSRRRSWTAAAGDRWSGWLVAAGLVGVLLVHHGFHRPLNHGWIVAGGLAIICVALMAYIRVLYRRALRAPSPTESDANQA